MRVTLLRKQILTVGIGLGCLGLFGLNSALAQVATTLKISEQAPLEITGKDIQRGENSLILLTPEYGKSTRTNAYGVEVSAVEMPIGSNRYKVLQVTDVWRCQKNNTLNLCGNATIPSQGIVLSASGDKRHLLLDHLKVGDLFNLDIQWFQQKTMGLSVINPTPKNNPLASGFPGYRASNQLIRYDQGYGLPRTGTNEFGYEVTVSNGVVVEQEGSDSAIPSDGFVLSGHGKAREWLITNAPLGAHITMSDDGKTITSQIDLATYQYQLTRRVQEAKGKISPSVQQNLTAAQAKINQLANQGKTVEATRLTLATLETVNRSLWSKYPAFPATAIRGIWHRPVEKTVADIVETLNTVKQAGFNTVFLETYFHGYTIFPSKVQTEYGIPSQDPQFAGLDPLQVWVTEAHRRGLKLHVWFQSYYVGTQTPGPVLSKYPDWANVQLSALSKKGPTASTLEPGAFFLDPANPDAEGYVLKLVDEIVSRYAIDGFQLDYMDYPMSFPPERFSYLKTTWGYTPIARSSFKQITGTDPIDLTPDQTDLWQAWMHYKEALINDYVQRASAIVHNKKPHCLVSATAFPKLPEVLIQKHENWALWAQKGWIEFIAPMLLTSSNQVILKDTQYVVSQAGKVPVVAGIFGPFNQNSAEQVLQQMATAKIAGAKGISVFDTAHLTRRMIQALHVAQPFVVKPAAKPVAKRH